MTKSEKHRVEILKAMDLLVRDINDENIHISWLMNGLPDGLAQQDDEAFMDFLDDETMEDIGNCFIRCIKRAEKDGFYFR